MSKKGNIIIICGILIISISMIMLSQNLISDYRAGLSSDNVVQKIEEYLSNNNYNPDTNNDVNYGSNTHIDSAENSHKSLLNNPRFCFENPDLEMPVLVDEEYSYIGIIEIPSINRKLPVISEFSYNNLSISPCRYYGSVYQKNMVIAAHNYLSHFGYIQNLSVDDDVYYIDLNNNIFKYTVALLETVNPQEVDNICSGEWDLTLFTCTFGGQYRTTVRCELNDFENN